MFGAEALYQSPVYKVIVEHLAVYGRGGVHRNWENYRLKIPPDVLGQLGQILSECRRNGFMFSHAYEGKLKWHQIMTASGVKSDLCGLCERECKRREGIDNGWYRGKVEPDPCWNG